MKPCNCLADVILARNAFDAECMECGAKWRTETRDGRIVIRPRGK